jgi:hypothetical protein
LHLQTDFIRHLYGETVSWSLAIASTAQLAIGRGSTPLGDTFFWLPEQPTCFLWLLFM